MKLTFGKHKGKTISDLMNEGEFGYIIWLEENVDIVNMDKNTYEYCKSEVFNQRIEHESIMDSAHSDWGCRD